MKIFFFWIWKTWIFQRNWKFWNFFFLKQPKKYEPNAASPKAFFENFLLFFLKILEILNFFMELKFLIDDFFLKNLEILNFFKELKIFIDDFFFLKNLEILNFFKELKILIFFFWKKPKKYEPNAPSPKAFFENFVFFFEDLFIIKKKVKKMKMKME